MARRSGRAASSSRGRAAAGARRSRRARALDLAARVERTRDAASIASSSSATPVAVAARSSRAPAAATRRAARGDAQRQHVLAARRSCGSASGRSALLTTWMSAISSMPALIAWMSSPRPGADDDDGRVRGARDVDLVLADADRLDDHDVVARGVEHVDRVERAAREPAERAARGHAADEDAGIAARARSCGCGRRGSRRRRTGSTDRPRRSPTLAAARADSPRERARPACDLPLPGTPVMPTTCARPARGAHRVERVARLVGAGLGARQQPRDRARRRRRARRPPDRATRRRPSTARHRARRAFISRKTSRSSITRRALKSVRGKRAGRDDLDLGAQPEHLAQRRRRRASRNASPRVRRRSPASASTRTSKLVHRAVARDRRCGARRRSRRAGSATASISLG